MSNDFQQAWYRPGQSQPCRAIVDVSPFIDVQSPSLQKQTAGDVRKKLRANGWVAITGHGVPSEVLDEAFSVAKAFFNLPYEEKMKGCNSDAPVPYRGYSGLGKNNVAAKTANDADGMRMDYS